MPRSGRRGPVSRPRVSARRGVRSAGPRSARSRCSTLRAATRPGRIGRQSGRRPDAWASSFQPLTVYRRCCARLRRWRERRRPRAPPGNSPSSQSSGSKSPRSQGPPPARASARPRRRLAVAARQAGQRTSRSVSWPSSALGRRHAGRRGSASPSARRDSCRACQERVVAAVAPANRCRNPGRGRCAGSAPGSRAQHLEARRGSTPGRLVVLVHQPLQLGQRAVGFRPGSAAASGDRRSPPGPAAWPGCPRRDR